MPATKNLVIVESPAKAKTIEKFLGKDFTVKSSFGHIRDLPKKDMGIDIEHDFTPKYVISDDKKKVISELKKAAKEATVWLASDCTSRPSLSGAGASTSLIAVMWCE